MFIEPRNEYLFIGLPRGTSDEYFLIVAEGLNDGQLLSCGLDLQYTIETSVANDRDIGDANS